MTIDVHDIQGNVLRSFRPTLSHGVFLSVRIFNPAAGRRLLEDLSRQVSNAHDARPHARALNVAISHRGLRKLRVPAPLLASFPPEFTQGMQARAEHLSDVGRGAPEHWEPGLRDIEILVVLHARDAPTLAIEQRLLRQRIDAIAGVQIDGCQQASVLKHGTEHFGYADGFGQPKPVIADYGPRERERQDAGRTIALGEFVHGYRDEDGGLAPAPAPPFERNGTFMVFRKLAQDVDGFRALLHDLAGEHFSGDEDFLAAKLAGRWRNGTPLIHRPAPDAEPSKRANALNDFGYRKDPNGYSCPIGAHIRRANPRDGLYGGYKRTRRHRIIRRGMPYGSALPEGSDPAAGEPADARGLLFVCFNANIARQFEVVNGWLNDGAAFGLGNDVDVLGGSRPAHLMSVQGQPPVLMLVRSLVWTRGGEYLFLPSLRALAALAEGRWEP